MAGVSFSAPGILSGSGPKISLALACNASGVGSAAFNLVPSTQASAIQAATDKVMVGFIVVFCIGFSYFASYLVHLLAKGKWPAPLLRPLPWSNSENPQTAF